MKKAFLSALSLFFTLSANAQQVLPTRDRTRLGLSIRSLSLPPVAIKDLSSGLPNRLFIDMHLQKTGNTVWQAQALVSITYDLWDENYRMSVELPYGKTKSMLFDSVPKLVQALSLLQFEQLYQLSSIEEKESFEWRVQIYLNPIEKEKLERLRKWVAENATPSTPDPSGAKSNNWLGGQGNRIFAKLFEEYAKGASISSLWSMTVKSNKFMPGELAE